MTAAVSSPLKDLYEIGEIPPLGHVPQSMYAWCIRQERHGAPESAMQIEVVPTFVMQLGARGVINRKNFTCWGQMPKVGTADYL